LNAPGEVILSFDHRYAMEPGDWDGGAVFRSVNGGAFTYVPSFSFSSNGYSGTVVANSLSQLAGQGAFVLTSPNHGSGSFLTSVASLGTFSLSPKPSRSV
jgi:hypothetical protein